MRTKEEVLAELRQIEAEEKRMASLSPLQLFATKLHSLTCRYNHIDGCAWYYNEKEPDFWIRRDGAAWETKAKILLRVLDDEDSVLEILKIALDRK